MATEQGAQVGEAAFARLLRQHRLAAGLSQEALAERAGLSDRAISALERGVNRAPRLETVTLLAAALALTDEQRSALLAAARPGQLPPAPASPQQPPPGAAPRHNLPAPPTPLVGREQAIVAVLARLREPGTRLLTLTGVGGVGKTRLALEVAHAALADFPDGAWLVPLAPLRDPALLVGAIAQAVGVRETGGRPLQEQLLEYLRSRRLLLVLDNFEHLLPAAPLVADVLAACPLLRVLVTSRAALRLRGERQYPVPPLALPGDLAHLPPAEALAGVAAVALFVQRARAVQPIFALTAANAATVAAICRKLEGLPLAIELAAARVRLLPPAALLRRLAHLLPLLTGGAPDAPERQRTMRATIAWSYDLLHVGEQVLLRRLAVFAGGCALGAVEAVCAVNDDLEGDLLDWLGALVDQSLLQVAGTEEEPRFSMLETVREYGLEQLAASGEEMMARDRHLAWCATLAEETEPRLTGPEQGIWLERLEQEHDNLRAALGWARERGEGDLGLRLAGALWRFWWTRGHLSEGREWLDAMLAVGDAAPAALRAAALNGAGTLAWTQGDYAHATALHEKSLALRRALGDGSGIAHSLGNLGNVAHSRGDYARATAMYEECLAIRRDLGDRQGIASTLGNLGTVAYQQGDSGRAATLQEESLALKRALGDTWGIAGSLANLGNVAYSRGQYGRAEALHEESLALFRELGDRQGIAVSLHNLGTVAHRQGNHERAAALLHEALLLGREIGAGNVIVDGVEGIAWIAAVNGQLHRAARLGGAAEALREALGVPLPPEQQAGHAEAVQAMRAELGEEAFAVAWAAGRAMPLETALTLALESYDTTTQGQ